MLEDYCSDFNATLTYYCAEHTHPLEATYWKIDLSIMIWNEARDSQKAETVHTHTARRAQAMDSKEDIAQEAYIHYHGRRYEAMKEDRFRFLPRHDPNDGTWVIQNPQNSDPTLNATVRHVHVMQMDNEDLKEELHEAQRTAKHLQKENDALRAQLRVMMPLL